MTHGIPTMHKGRRFRSRLEARWATFFDLVGWPYEYEPFDMNGWIPDFVLLGPKSVLVEIKPVHEFPCDVAEKCIRAGCDRELLILGCTVPASPISMDGLPPIDDEFARYCMGWLSWPKVEGLRTAPWAIGEESEEWAVSEAMLTSGQSHERDSVFPKARDVPQFGLCSLCGPIHDRIRGAKPPGSEIWVWTHPASVENLWAESGNRTQWNPR